MPRLNNDERNQAIGMQNTGMSATVVSKAYGDDLVSQETLSIVFEVVGHM